MRRTAILIRIVLLVGVLCGLARAGIVISARLEDPPADPWTPTNFEPYLLRANGNPADPVNLIFHGGNADTAAAAVQRVLGWRVTTGSSMAFFVEGERTTTAWEFGIDVGPGVRNHMRLAKAATDGDQTYVLGAVHRDETVSCGHVGRAFDETRDLVARAFQDAGYTVRVVALGNTTRAPHCDGTLNAGDGGAVIIELNPQ